MIDARKEGIISNYNSFHAFGYCYEEVKDIVKNRMTMVDRAFLNEINTFYSDNVSSFPNQNTRNQIHKIINDAFNNVFVCLGVQNDVDKITDINVIKFLKTVKDIRQDIHKKMHDAEKPVNIVDQEEDLVKYYSSLLRITLTIKEDKKGNAHIGFVDVNTRTGDFITKAQSKLNCIENGIKRVVLSSRHLPHVKEIIESY